MAEHTSDTLTGGPKQGRRNETNRQTDAAGGRDSAGLTNRGSGVGTTERGSASGAAGLTRHRSGKHDGDDRMNAQVESKEAENPTLAHGEGMMESRNTRNADIASSASSGPQDTTTGPGEARRNPERRGNIYDPDQPDPHANPRV